MCIDMKISKNLNKEKKKAKYEIGNFCEQYGLSPTAPSRRKHHIKKQRKYHNGNITNEKTLNQMNIINKNKKPRKYYKVNK
jgi:hypothetical protein